VTQNDGRDFKSDAGSRLGAAAPRREASMVTATRRALIGRFVFALEREGYSHSPPG